jgi:hypothetical protein
MDEDGGSRTPPRSRSPDAMAVRLPPSRFAAEAGKAGSAAPVTPTTGGLPVHFISPVAPGEDSLPASFDSLTLHHAGSGAMSTGGSMGGAAASAFRGATSFAPSGSAVASTGGGSGDAARRAGRKTRSRRKLAVGSRLLKLTAQNYPPLVESRAGGAPSMSALAVFRDLSEEQWERFMDSVRRQVARKLREGAWRQGAPSKTAPLMSCPRF